MSAVPHLDHFERFGVTESEWRRVLAEATSLGADDADLFFEHTTATAVSLSDRIVNSAHTSVDLGVGIRVVVGDQVGYAYTEELTLAAMLDAARILIGFQKLENVGFLHGSIIPRSKLHVTSE